jgi:hypothetical protein
MYLEGKIEFLVYRDTAQTEFPQKKVTELSEIFNSTSVDESQVLDISLAALGSQTINFNGVGTTNYIYIYSDTTDINVNFNALGNILFKAQIPSHLGIEATSCVITNSSASTATNVYIAMVTG